MSDCYGQIWALALPSAQNIVPCSPPLFFLIFWMLWCIWSPHCSAVVSHGRCLAEFHLTRGHDGRPLWSCAQRMPPLHPEEFIIFSTKSRRNSILTVPLVGYVSCKIVGWFVMYYALQSSVQVLTHLLIHQYVHG